MGATTEDGEEINSGSTKPERIKPSKETCEFEEWAENNMSLPQDADCYIGIQDQKWSDGSGIQPFFPMYNMPQRPTSNALNTDHKEAEEQRRNARGSALSAISQRPHSDTMGNILERVQSTWGTPNTDMPFDLEKSVSPPTSAEIMRLLDIIGNDEWDAMYETLQEEMSLAESDMTKQDPPINPDIDLMDEEGYTPLYKAALKGHLESVDNLISQGANPDKPSKGGLTPLHAAAQVGHDDIVDYLILQGADVNVECEMGQTPLHTAAENGHANIINTFFAEGTDVNKKDKTGGTPFNAAVENGHLETLADLLSKGAKQNRYRGYTPLHWAAHYGHLHIVKFLVSKGADVNEVDGRGMIALHGAASTGHVDIMEYLILQGSDLNTGDSDGWTPLNAAIQEGHLKAVDYLITKGAKQNRCDGETSLYSAANFGHLHLVKFFIANGENVNEPNDNGMIPLHGAAVGGHMDVMEYLIQQGSDVNKGHAKGWTPFNAAVQCGHLEAVKYLIAKGAKQNRYDGMTPLSAAAQFGHLDLVKVFISEGADVNEEHDEGMIPLHGAAARGHIEVMEYLIQQGSDVNKCDAKGWTPFNAAVQYGNLEAVKYLMDNEAKENRFDGMTPSYVAAQSGHLNCLDFFISKGADVNEEDEMGQIPLTGAAARGHLKVLEYLIQQGSNVNKKDHTGWTPFHGAVRNSHLEAVKFLMANGAQCDRINGFTPLYIATQHDHTALVKFLVSKEYDVNERNECGKSPLLAACYNGNMDVVKYLVDHKANVNAQDSDGWTPLHAAAQEGHRGVVEFLALNGADVTAKDIDGWTPLQAAAQEGHRDVVEFLALNGTDTTSKDSDGKTQLQTAEKGGHAKVTDYLALLVDDTLNEDTSDPNCGSYQGDVQKHDISSKCEALQEDEDRYNREGRSPTNSAAKRFDPEQPNDPATVDSMDGNSLADADEKDFTSIHNEHPPTIPPRVEKGDKDESNPFVSARLKCPGETATTSEDNQVNGSKGSRSVEKKSRGGLDRSRNICPAQYDRSTQGFNDSRDHKASSLLNGPPSWKRGSCDQSCQHTTETNCHSYEETEPRCHTILGEPFSQMNARNDEPTTENPENLRRTILSSPPLDHPESYECNSFFTGRPSLYSKWKKKEKRRIVDSLCSSFLVIIQSLLHMIIALAIILAGSPVLVAGSDSTERVTLQVGQPAIIPFDIPRFPDNIFQDYRHFTLGFGSKPRPFCINGEYDIDGFKSPSQFSRFNISVAEIASTFFVRVNIDPVNIVDEDLYVLRTLFGGFGNVHQEIVIKEILVQIPPGPTKCFITICENNKYPYEVHCQATSGSVKTSLTCYQYGQRVKVKGDVTDNGQVTRGVFLLPDHSPFSCCSHDVTSEVSVTMCNDFVWPPSNNHISPSTVNDPNHTPSVANTVVGTGNTEQASNTLVESHVDSGACKQYIASSVSLTIGLMITWFCVKVK